LQTKRKLLRRIADNTHQLLTPFIRFSMLSQVFPTTAAEKYSTVDQKSLRSVCSLQLYVVWQ
jgi:hypothetical protein